MELDPIAYIDIVQICTVILAPGKPLTQSSLHCSPRPSSFMHREGRGWNRHSALFNKQLLPRTLALMPHEKKTLYGHSGLCAPGPVSAASLP